MTREQIDLAKFLNQQYLCESLTIKEVQTLLDYTDVVTFNKGDIIADIGQVGDALFFAMKGEAILLFQDGEQETEVGRMKEGELIGNMSFFDRHPRSVRLRANSDDTQLLKLTRIMYNRLRVEHPYIAVNFLEHAIISLDHLVRRVSSDVATFTHYMFTPGRK